MPLTTDLMFAELINRLQTEAQYSSGLSFSMQSDWVEVLILGNLAHASCGMWYYLIKSFCFWDESCSEEHSSLMTAHDKFRCCCHFLIIYCFFKFRFF